jgi:hypothetical protein
MRKGRSVALLAGAVVAACASGGCFPYSMGIFTPIPVPPWVAERMEEKYCHDRDFKTPVLPPIREGFPPPVCEDPPDDARVLRALEPVTRGVPYFYEEFRDNIEIVKERIKDTIDPPRFFPLIGPAQLHHCHWKCTVAYTETIEEQFPFPWKCVKPRVKVVYMDLDHLHLYPGCTPEAQQAVSRDLSGP